MWDQQGCMWFEKSDGLATTLPLSSHIFETQPSSMHHRSAHHAVIEVSSL